MSKRLPSPNYVVFDPFKVRAFAEATKLEVDAWPAWRRSSMEVPKRPQVEPSTTKRRKRAS